MRFNFPQKTEKLKITLDVSRLHYDFIRVIAANKDITQSEVVATILDAVMDEVRTEQPELFTNEGGAIEIAESKKYRVCAYKGYGTAHTTKTHQLARMFECDGKYFCSTSCMNLYIEERNRPKAEIPKTDAEQSAPDDDQEKIIDQKEYQRQYYQANKERLVEGKRERRHKHGISPKEKARKAEYMKEYWEKNKDKHHAPKANTEDPTNDIEDGKQPALEGDELLIHCAYEGCNYPYDLHHEENMWEHEGEYYCSKGCLQQATEQDEDGEVKSKKLKAYKTVTSSPSSEPEALSEDEQVDDPDTEETSRDNQKPSERIGFGKNFIRRYDYQTNVTFCQNVTCKHKIIEPGARTSRYDGLVFCSAECLAEFQTRNALRSAL